MNAGTGDYRNEFFGEIARYCIDGDSIWFYDEISGGLYRLDKREYIVEAILSPMEIHQKEVRHILQILKWRNEVYLISENISHELLVYNIASKRLRSVLLSSRSYKIGNAVSIGKWIYLIPENTDQILTIVEAGTLIVKRVISDWYKGDTEALECWGYSVYEDDVFFPIIGKKEIFQIQGEKIAKLSLDIKRPIYSISASTNGIWILPSEGNSIFCVDKDGKLKDSIEIRVSHYEDTADHFARIIVIGIYVYLFPKQGGQILVLETKSKKWIAVGEKKELFYRSLLQKVKNVPYWGYYCKNEILYTLPLRYRFAEIDIESKSIHYKTLQFADTLMRQQYAKWVCWLNEMNQTNYYVERERESLSDFVKIASGNGVIHNNKKIFIGKKVWMRTNKK